MRYSLLAVILCTKLLQADPFSLYYEVLDLDQTTVLCDSRQAGSCDSFSGQIEFNVPQPRLYMEPNQIYSSEAKAFEVFNNTDYYLHVISSYSETIDLGYWEWAGGPAGSVFVGGVEGSYDSSSAFTPIAVEWPWPAGPRVPTGFGMEGKFGEPFHLLALMSGGEDLLFAPGGGRSVSNWYYAWNVRHSDTYLKSDGCSLMGRPEGCTEEDRVNAYLVPSLPSGDPAPEVPEPSTYLLMSAGLALLKLGKRSARVHKGSS